MASSLLPWLLSGGTLALHHPFDGDVLERQINEQACDTLVAPAPLALRLAESGMPVGDAALRTVIGLWRTPEQVARAFPGRAARLTLTDIYLFGEAGCSAPAARTTARRRRSSPAARRAAAVAGSLDRRRHPVDPEGDAGTAWADDPG